MSNFTDFVGGSGGGAGVSLNANPANPAVGDIFVFDTSTTISFGVDVTARVTVMGGGGGAVGRNQYADIRGNGGGGGATQSTVSLVANTDYTIVVGSGANTHSNNISGDSSFNNNSVGGTSSFSGGAVTTLTANGGNSANMSAYNNPNNGNGGTGSGGAVNFTGNSGTLNYAGTPNVTSVSFVSKLVPSRTPAGNMEYIAFPSVGGTASRNNRTNGSQGCVIIEIIGV